MTNDADILIVGAGAAGLAAARELSFSKLSVVVLEARNRIGGRINTHFDSGFAGPIELGAEFVHGVAPETFKIADRTRVTLLEAPNVHWYFHNAVLSKTNEFWANIEKAMDELADYKGPDEPFAEFLDNYIHRHNLTEARSMATLYVEGFHAAHADRISVKGLIKTNRAAAQIDDERQFRPSSGYVTLAQKLHDEAVEQGASFRFETVVREIAWSAGAVTVTTTGGEQFKARRLLVTLRLGVLQGDDVSFVPRLRAKEEAAQSLAMGQVVKVLLRFREPFWEDLSLPLDDGKRENLKDFSFIHAPGEMPPTWWTQLPVRSPLLVGWAGGTRAEELLKVSQDELLDRSLAALSHIFAVSRDFLEDSLVNFYTHNWTKDPFSLGAYSYIPVGGLHAQAELSEPIENTIYFAGEAASTTGHHGTVHGAIQSGLRAAQMIRCSPGTQA
jgi:monoamine oxidase